jgi:hypothetical protein
MKAKNKIIGLICLLMLKFGIVASQETQQSSNRLKKVSVRLLVAGVIIFFL